MYRYYELLGVSRDADDAAIKRAYHRQALKLHPDKPGGSTAAFRELDRAQKVLTDRRQRYTYDRLGFDMEEDEGDTLEDHINKACLETTDDVLKLATRTALGGLCVTVFLRFRFFRWLQGIVSVSTCGLGLLSNIERLEAKTRAGEDFSIFDKVQLSAKLIGHQLFAVFIAGWVAQRTSFGTRRWVAGLSLAWLYEAGIIFAVAGCYRDENGALLPRPVLAAQAFGCLVAARVLDGRFWRWVFLFAVEMGYAFVLHYAFEVAGHVATKAMISKFERYSLKTNEIIELERLKFQSLSQ